MSSSRRALLRVSSNAWTQRHLGSGDPWDHAFAELRILLEIDEAMWNEGSTKTTAPA